MADIRHVRLNNTVYNLRDSGDKKIVFISDSYGVNPSTSDNWIIDIIEYLGLTLGTDAFYYAIGGASFGGTDGFSLFKDMVNDVEVGIPLNEITDVVICGGYNDLEGIHGSTSQNIANGIKFTKENVETRFPNAVLHIGFVGWTTNGNIAHYVNYTLADYINGCNINGIHYLNNVEYAMHHDTLFISDGIHPNTYGSVEIAKAVANAILTGSAHVVKPFKNANFVASSGVAVTTFNWILATQLSDNVEMISMFYNAESTSVSFGTPVSTDVEYTLGTISDTYIVGDNYRKMNVIIPVTLGSLSAGIVNGAFATFTVHNRQIKFIIHAPSGLSDINAMIVQGRASTCIPSILA